MSTRFAFFTGGLPAVSFLTLVFVTPSSVATPCARLRRACDRHVGQGGVVTSRPAVLVHLCSVDDWSSAQVRGQLCPESLAGAGFIHLSTPDQVHLPANRLYRGRADLVLLHIDPARLTAPVRWEPGVATDPDSMMFPHLYGALPVEAVISVTRYRPDPNGDFPPVGA
ncbi:MAG: DUF952 domain-containing protein [Mycobacterium sp.]|nr:DUF952 domain-containing protein [Mycobacterium sp.]